MRQNMAGVNECFSIGSIVVCKTCYNKEIEGEVLAFDPQTKMLILKCPASNGRPTLNDVHIVNLALVSDVAVKKEVNTVPEAPQSLNLQRLNTRVRNQVEEKRRLVTSLAAGVSPEGQRLFLAISRTISEVAWQGHNIVVFDQVTITPPYKLDNIKGNTESKAFMHIRKVERKMMVIVHKYVYVMTKQEKEFFVVVKDVWEARSTDWVWCDWVFIMVEKHQKDQAAADAATAGGSAPVATGATSSPQ